MAEDKNLAGTVDYWPEPTAKESIPANIGRQIYRTGRNALVTALGAPSDIAEGALNLVNTGIELLPGVKKSPLPNRLPLPTSEWIGKNVVEPIEEKVLPAGYAESHNEPEEMWDTFTKDFVGFLSGGRVTRALGAGARALGAGAKAIKGGAALAKGAAGLSEAAMALPFANTFMKVAKFLNPGKASVGKSAVVAGLGNLAQYGSKYLGAEPGTQAGLKVGTMLAASLGGVNTLGNEIKDEFQALNTIVPRGKDAVLSTVQLQKELTNLMKTEVKRGLPASVVPAKGFLKSTIKGVKERTQQKIVKPKKVIDIWDAMTPLEDIPGVSIHPAYKNAMPINTPEKAFSMHPSIAKATGSTRKTASIDELWKMKKELNNVIYESNRHIDATKIHYAEQVRDALNKTLKGPQAHIKFPEFTASLIHADSMMHGFKNVSEISKFLVGHDVLKDLSNPITRLVFYTNLSGGIWNIAGKAATAPTLKNTVAPVEMFMRSPEIRNYYYKAMKAAYARNAPVANRYIKKFDHEANKLNPGYQEGPGTVE